MVAQKGSVAVGLQRTTGILFFLLLCVSVVTPGSSMAQQNSISALEDLVERVSIDVNSFSIIGDNPLDETTSYAIVNQFTGPGRGIDDIEQAAAALEAKLRDLGESFYRVSFLPQELTDGVVDLMVRRYTIGNISVQGNKHYSDQNVINSLPQLVRGSAPSTNAIARSLTVANQNPGKRTRLTLAAGSSEGEIDAKLSVVDQKPLVLSVWTNNSGTDSSGDFRVGTNITHRNLFGRDHVGAFTFITSPEDPDEVQQFAVNYRIPVYKRGASVTLIGVKSEIDSGIVVDAFDVAGRGEVFGAGYSQVLPKIGEYRHQLSAQLTDKLFDNDIRFQGTQLLSDVRSRPLELSYQASWKSTNGLELSGSVSAVQNLGGGSDNNDFAYESSRSGASQDWNKLEVGASLQYVREKWLYTAALKVSASADRLVTGEQFALGGSSTIRGMEERELRGDQGARVNLQAWGPPIARTIRPIFFLDAGRVKINDPVAGEFDSESVTSVGVMLNWNPRSELTASLSYGYLIDGIDFNADGAELASRDGDSKFHFNVTLRF